jgi:hypothetical protein
VWTYISIDRVQIEDSHPHNAFGEVASADLRLRCDHLLHGLRLPEQNQDKKFVLKLGKERIWINLRYDSSDEPSKQPMEFHLLPIGDVTEENILAGLMLQATCNSSGEYRRIGLFSCLSWHITYMRAFWEAARGDGVPAEDWEYAHVEVDENGERRKYINII